MSAAASTPVYLAMTGAARALGDGIQMALHAGPDDLPVAHVVRHRVDTRQCLPGTGLVLALGTISLLAGLVLLVVSVRLSTPSLALFLIGVR
jgi:hypothetical protein